MIKIPKNESLNIVPFIDVMLVLLTIVLSISTFVAQGKIKIDLPSASNQEKIQDEKSIKILINNKNEIYIEDTIIAIEHLEQRILSVPRDTKIELVSDKEAKFDTFIQIVDVLKGKNHENFSIATQQK